MDYGLFTLCLIQSNYRRLWIKEDCKKKKIISFGIGYIKRFLAQPTGS